MWIIERYTLLSAFNLYPALALAAALAAIGVFSHRALLERGAVIAVLALASMTATAMRHRSHALGAGGSLRAHELERRWIWQPRPHRERGERVYLAAQGEVVHRRPWSPEVPYVSLQAPGQRRAPRHRSQSARLALGEGQHVFVVGA